MHATIDVRFELSVFEALVKLPSSIRKICFDRTLGDNCACVEFRIHSVERHTSGCVLNEWPDVRALATVMWEIRGVEIDCTRRRHLEDLWWDEMVETDRDNEVWDRLLDDPKLVRLGQ
jgi:hypothetical protein